MSFSGGRQDAGTREEGLCLRGVSRPGAPRCTVATAHPAFRQPEDGRAQAAGAPALEELHCAGRRVPPCTGPQEGRTEGGPRDPCRPRAPPAGAFPFSCRSAKSW